MLVTNYQKFALFHIRPVRSPSTLHTIQRMLSTSTCSANVNTTSLKSKLIYIILKGGRLCEENKRPFRDYWKSITSNLQATKIKTLLDEIPLYTFAQFLNENRRNSSTVRGCYRREMLFNCNNNIEKVNELIKELRLSEKDSKSREDVLSLCIKDSLHTKDVVMAADLFILYAEINSREPLRDDLCSTIISALAFENPRYDHMHLIKYLELHNLYSERNSMMKLSQIQIVTLCNKTLSLEDAPILTKETLNRIMNTELTAYEKSRNEKITAAYHLIEKDCAINNAAGVFLTWTKIKDFYTSITKHDPRIVYKIIKIFTSHKAYRSISKDIILQLPPEYYCNNPLILPTVIDYTTKVVNLSLAKEVMENVNKYIQPENTQIVLFSKRCLSSLLRMHLIFKDPQGVDRVLKQIVDIFGKHSEENILALVSQMLRVKTLDNISKAIQLVNSIPPRHALLAYGSIISKIVEWQIASDGRFDVKSMPLINELLMKAHKQDPEHKSSLWNVISSLFIKKLVHYRNFQRKIVSTAGSHTPRKLDTINLDLAKLIYIRSDNKTVRFSKIHYNPFIRSSPQKVILKITNTNRFVILRNIALSAIKGRRRDIFRWCCSELYKNGMPIKELLIDWNMVLNYEVRRAQFIDKKKIEEDLSLKGISFIRNALK